MSSIDIHLCIANKLKEKFNMSNEFIFGQILPDLKSVSGEGSERSHYIKEYIIDGYIKKLPNISRFEEENAKKLDAFDELTLGYFMHLIQDLIWYNDFIPNYARYIQDKRFDVLDVIENRLIPLNEFSRRIHSDYLLINEYQKKNFGYTNEYFLNELVQVDLFEKYKEIIYNDLVDVPLSVTRRINYFSDEDSDEYVRFAYKKSEEVLMKYVKKKK